MSKLPEEFMAAFFNRIFDEMQTPDFYVNMGTFPRKHMAETELLGAADMVVGIISLPEDTTSLLLAQFFELIWGAKPEWERENEKKSLLEYYVAHSEPYGRILRNTGKTNLRNRLLVKIMVFIRLYCLTDLQARPSEAEKRFEAESEKDEIKIEELSEDVVAARFVMRQMGTIRK